MADEYRDTVDDASSGRVINPGDADAIELAPEPERKRKQRSDKGQPRGSRGSTARTEKGSKRGNVHLDLSAMQGLLVGMTAMLAMRTGHDEIAVGEDEAAAFLKAAQNVARHYSVETTQRTLDWIAFAGVSVQVFGTRVVAVALNEARARRGNAPRYAAHMNGGAQRQPEQQSEYVPSVVPPSDFSEH